METPPIHKKFSHSGSVEPVCNGGTDGWRECTDGPSRRCLSVFNWTGRTEPLSVRGGPPGSVPVRVFTWTAAEWVYRGTYQQILDPLSAM